MCLQAQTTLTIQVLTAFNKPVRDVGLSLTAGGSGSSDVNGQATVALPPGTQPGSSVHVLLAPPTMYRIFSPFEQNIVVPANHAAFIYVCQPPCKELLSGGSPTASLVGRITAYGSPNSRGENGDRNYAIDAIRKARAAETTSVLKLLMIDSDDFNSAIQSAARAGDPYLRGVTLLYDVKHADAIKELTAAIKDQGARTASATPRPGDTADPYFFRAQAYLETNKAGSALEDLSRANQLRPGSPLVLRALGSALIQSGQRDAGTARLAEAQKIVYAYAPAGGRARGGRQ